MTMTTDDTYASFNARAVPARVLAKTFIAPKQFAVLARVAHTVVVGPRGSGKTTLLKMLTPEALGSPDAQTSLTSMPAVAFTGIFIPTDINWGRQLEAYRSLDIPPTYGDALVRASFTTAVLRAFVTALQQRTALPDERSVLHLARLTLTSEQEGELVEAIADTWHLVPRIKSILGLKVALSNRMSAIAKFALSEQRRGSDGREHRFSENNDLDTAPMPSLSAALDVVEALLPDMLEERWALLFDELELAPAEIRAELLEAIRSVDDRFLFKLSLSPFSAEFSKLTSALSAMPGHDHDEVSLSYGRKEEGVGFSLELMRAIVNRRGYAPSELEHLLGFGDFPSEEDRPPRRESVRVLRAFDDAYYGDRTFRQYANKHGGSLDGYLGLEGDKRAQFVRKVVPLVIVRSAFRKGDGTGGGSSRVFKARKNADIYRGYASIATLLEGNPRYIIGVMNGLLADSSRGRIGGPRQTSEIAKAANRFRALLTTIPGPTSLGDRRALLGLIDLLGEYFRRSIIAEDFSPDPVGSFTVDATAGTDLLEAIGQLVNAGALVYVPDPEGGAIMTSLRGKRLRLNYLLASQYGLPLRLERPVALSRVLSSRRRSIDNNKQESLFGDQEGT